MFKFSFTLFCALIGFNAIAQSQQLDSLASTEILEEVILLSSNQHKNHTENKSLASLESYLQESNAVNFIKRGAYAWEPMIQGMSSERNLITIEGMRIYGACTDKMDPITSYVEISNLSKANIKRGQAGAENGVTIGGSIDLKRKKTGYGESGLKANLQSGFESVNQQKVLGAAVQYGTDKFFTDIDIMYRDAENYDAGGGKEILYSQFTKYNFSFTSGVKLDQNNKLEASLIFDEARDVGYPALPMDVSLARAYIGSLEYIHTSENTFYSSWRSKIYYNDVTHIMDDSKRPVVPIRMDMPGWSKTWGMYSKLVGTKEKHNWNLSFNSHFNNSLAEMTMYPDNPNEKEMFMLTWPDVNTIYAGIFAQNKYYFNEHFSADFSLGAGVHQNSIQDEFGLASLRIFYPDMNSSKTRFLINTALAVDFKQNNWKHSIGFGYGERAPSVSEAYGNYLFNSFDGFDYIGNPNMKNEKSKEISWASQYKKKQFKVNFNTALYHINDYIIGRPDPSLSPMNIGINGVKVYEQVNYALLWSTDLSANYNISKAFSSQAKLIYRLGQDDEKNNLPLIQPLTIEASLRYKYDTFYAELGFQAATEQSASSPEFGENKTPEYGIVNLALSKIVYFEQQKLILKAGGENLFDTNYSTFSDWNNIARPGRNIYANVIYSF